MAFDLYNFNLSSTMSSIKSFAGDYLTYLFYGLILVGIGYYFIYSKNQKEIFKHPVRVFRRRENGKVKEINYMGGYIKDKLGTEKFIVKISKFKKKTLDKVPDANFMDEDDRVYYYALSPEYWIQVKREFNVQKVKIKNPNYKIPTNDEVETVLNHYRIEAKEKYTNLDEKEIENISRYYTNLYFESLKESEIEVTDMVYEAVPTDLKNNAIVKIQNIKGLLNIDANKQFAYFVVGVIALVILGAVIFYLAINKGEIPILK